MKNSNKNKPIKVISLICALTMLISVFSLFASAFTLPVSDSDTTVETVTPVPVTYQLDMVGESARMVCTIPAILTEFTIPATPLTDMDSETLSVIYDAITSESDEEFTTIISAEPLPEPQTEPVTTETVIKTPDKNGKVTEEPSTETRTEPVERIFTVNGITVDCSGSSMFDDMVLYIKDVIENLPPIAFRLGDYFDSISFYDDLTADKGLDSDVIGYSIGSEIWVETYLQTKTDIVSTIYHEVGHKVDRVLARLRFSALAEWEEVAFSDEGATLCDLYGGDIRNDEYRRPLETFAIAYEAYMLGSIDGNSFNLKKKCPNIYALLNEALTSKYVTSEQFNDKILYFNNFDDVNEWFVERVKGNQTEIDKFTEWSKTATVGDKYNCNYGFYVEWRNA